MYINKAVSTLVIASLLQTASTAIYYVVPDNSSQVASDTSTLQYILDNISNYTPSYLSHQDSTILRITLL